VIRIALPTGDLRDGTARLLDAAALGIGDYAAGARALRYPMLGGVAVARVFREKDIPVQVALGNYDLGICSLSWIEDLTQRFPAHHVVRVSDLGFGGTSLWLAGAAEAVDPSIRIVSEYANIAESIARQMRLPRYRVFGVWGAAEAYPPEDADIALIAAADADEVEAHGLRQLARVLDSSAWLIANADSVATKDLSAILSPLISTNEGGAATRPRFEAPQSLAFDSAESRRERANIRLALPDGHQQTHAISGLKAAGIHVFGYEDGTVVRRPQIDVEGVEVKVIRPQDMPQMVALGQFDLAVTGRDVLFDHVVQFPSSPVEQIIDLGRSRYTLAAIVKDVRADSVAGAVREWRSARPDAPIRVASEFPNIADHFARERHLGRYSVIPIAGASEGFVPDDAEILIEGIETGASVRANKLTVLERFFESTNCVITNKQRPAGARGAVFEALVARLRLGALEPQPAQLAGG
jgi:ATP phosphoribosyltransferase